MGSSLKIYFQRVHLDKCSQRTVILSLYFSITTFFGLDGEPPRSTNFIMPFLNYYVIEC